MTADDTKSLRKALRKDGIENIHNKFLIKGVEIRGNGPVGIRVNLGVEPDRKQNAPWLQIMLKVSDEVMKELRVRDPLQDQQDENND